MALVDLVDLAAQGTHFLPWCLCLPLVLRNNAKQIAVIFNKTHKKGVINGWKTVKTKALIKLGSCWRHYVHGKDKPRWNKEETMELQAKTETKETRTVYVVNKREQLGRGKRTKHKRKRGDQKKKIKKNNKPKNKYEQKNPIETVTNGSRKTCSTSRSWRSSRTRNPRRSHCSRRTPAWKKAISMYFNAATVAHGDEKKIGGQSQRSDTWWQV